jgi:thiamine-phosphate pyrophosphorylase
VVEFSRAAGAATSLPAPPVLLITDRKQTRRPLAEVVAAVLEGGCRWVSVREKDLAPTEQVALAREIVRMAEPFAARVLLHGDPRLAAQAGCAGVHLPADGDVVAARNIVGPGAWVSISTHGFEEAVAAAEAGADAVALSPIFPSASKPGYGPALGLDRLAEVAAASPIPVIALGGIEDAARVRACLDAGAAAVAVMGAAMRAAAPARLLARLIRATGESRQSNRRACRRR